MMLKSRHKNHGLRITLALVLVLLGVYEAQAAWRVAGDVSIITREESGVTMTLTSGARVSVIFTAPSVVRVRLTPNGNFAPDFSYAVQESRERMRVNVEESSDAITIATAGEGAARVRITRRPFLVEVFDGNGRMVLADDPARPVMFDSETGAVQTTKIRAGETETYYGFGEKALPMSRHNQAMVMWNTDTYGYPSGLDPIYQSIPFFIALNNGRAYAVFLDNTYRTSFDMGRSDPARYTFGASGGELNYYVFTGDGSPRSIVRDYTRLTGRAPLPPLWALGYQQSRWSYYPEARVRELARRFRAERVPADVLYLDIDYMDGFRVFTWNRERFPDPARMIRDLRADGFRTVLIVDPGIKVDENYATYREGRAGNHFHQTAEGAEFQARVWPGVCAFPDFTNPRTREWFGSLYRAHLTEGVSGFWNDMNEPATFLPDDVSAEPRIFHHPGKTFPYSVRHAGDGQPGDHARYHNVYGMQMARSTFEGLRRLAPNVRPFVLTRAGYAGVQRYAAVWTGDNVASWEHLQLTIPMLVNLGVSGVSLVGADVGGFSGNPSPELYTRWLQAAALTPLMRSHVESGHPDREPWMHGEPYTTINRRTIELRYQLLPYLYSLFHEHSETGAPVMRPLWFEYPADKRTYLIEDQFLVGRDLLVAPVVRERATMRRVYFPQGDAWIDWWTGVRYAGGTEGEISAQLDRLPLFVRVGASVPTQPVIQHTGEMRGAPLTLSVGYEPLANVTNERNSSVVYQDAGEGYERGALSTMRVTQTGNTLFIARGSSQSGHAVTVVEFLGINAPPREVRVDGRRIENASNASYDAARRRLTVPLLNNRAQEILIVGGER